MKASDRETVSVAYFHSILALSSPHFGLGDPSAKESRFASVIYDCIEHAPDTQRRTIIALGHSGGLRCPIEVLGLKWSDVDLPSGKTTIHAPKTALTPISRRG